MYSLSFCFLYFLIFFFHTHRFQKGALFEGATVGSDKIKTTPLRKPLEKEAALSPRSRAREISPEGPDFRWNRRWAAGSSLSTHHHSIRKMAVLPLGAHEAFLILSAKLTFHLWGTQARGHRIQYKALQLGRLKLQGASSPLGPSKAKDGVHVVIISPNPQKWNILTTISSECRHFPFNIPRSHCCSRRGTGMAVALRVPT